MEVGEVAGEVALHAAHLEVGVVAAARLRGLGVAVVGHEPVLSAPERHVAARHAREGIAHGIAATGEGHEAHAGGGGVLRLAPVEGHVQATVGLIAAVRMSVAEVLLAGGEEEEEEKRSLTPNPSFPSKARPPVAFRRGEGSI